MSRVLPPPYDPQVVEAAWQARWVEQRTNEPDLDRPRRPFYNLMMFPYPSAEGLHVGNMFAFTGADIYGRFKRLQGHDVFEPIGFDAFGIHSENYALSEWMPKASNPIGSNTSWPWSRSGSTPSASTPRTTLCRSARTRRGSSPRTSRRSGGS